MHSDLCSVDVSHMLNMIYSAIRARRHSLTTPEPSSSKLLPLRSCVVFASLQIPALDGEICSLMTGGSILVEINLMSFVYVSAAFSGDGKQKKFHFVKQTLGGYFSSAAS